MASDSIPADAICSRVCIAIAGRMSSTGGHPLLVDMRAIRSVTTEVIGNLSLRLGRSPVATRLSTNSDDALAWLRHDALAVAA